MPVDRQGILEQEKRLYDVKETLHDQMMILSNSEQLSVGFLNAFSDLIDGASPDEIAGLLAVCTGVYEIVESLGSTSNDTSGEVTTGNTTGEGRSTRASTTEHYSSPIIA